MKQGTITGISGPVIDVRFPGGSLPAINEALTVEANGQRYTMETAPGEQDRTLRDDGRQRRACPRADRHRHRTRYPGAGG